ncbi:MAG: hypothetical protein WB870_02160 [Gallionellaceae bacterium]
MRSIATCFIFLLCLICPMLASAVTPMVTAGYAHTVALKSDGTVEAWGDNSYGQLGVGTTTSHLAPVKLWITGVKAVAAGDSHSVAVKTDGTVLVWGDNSYGQLGDGTTTGRLSPETVKGLTGVVAVAGGVGHTVALKSDGTVVTWGSNPDGELGNGTTNDSYTPITVPGLTGVVAISVGPSGYHTVALKSDGTVVAWGYNISGQLGDGTTDNGLTPVAVPGLAGVVAVAAGDAHSVALKSDGTVMAWGSNSNGQLGDGTSNDSYTPVAVAGLAGVVAVAAGDAHTVAVKSDGTVAAWGYNGDGELGDGTTTDSPNPVAVPGLAGVVGVAAGDYHTVAVKFDGVVVGWGYNGDGELGDGTTTDRLSPVEAYGLISAVACNTTSAANMVNTCIPEVHLYVAGSSALGGALATVIQTDLFDTTAQPIIKILDNGSANGTGGANAVSAWYGMSKAGLTGGASKRLFVVYNNNNGSGAGVSQLLAKLGTIPEADVVTIGPAMTIAKNFDADSCSADSSSTTLAPVIACASHAPTQADMAISDVNVTELYKLEAPSSGKLAALTTLTTTQLALQGFGVAVNANLYASLQGQNIADGLLRGSCAGDATAACQPSIRRADYTSLVAGTIKSAAALLNNPSDTSVLTLARGSDLSGMLAASNIFLADNPCGNNHDAMGKTIAGVVGGMLDIVSTTDSTANLVVQANATTNNVVTALNATSGYAIGVLGLGIVPGGGDTWKFVKLDGISPNFNADGSADAYQRNAFISGNYPFAMTYVAVTPVKPAKASTATTTGYTVVSTLINGLRDSTLHNLTGIGYLDHAANTEQSLVAHGGPATINGIANPLSGNNCSPLIE